jgi:hypothetical protein
MAFEGTAAEAEQAWQASDYSARGGLPTEKQKETPQTLPREDKKPPTMQDLKPVGQDDAIQRIREGIEEQEAGRSTGVEAVTPESQQKSAIESIISKLRSFRNN